MAVGDDLLERAIDADALAALREIGRRAEFAGGRAALVGGSVRDLILGREIHDLDVVVDADLEPICRGLGARLRRHPAFETATVYWPGGLEVDLARARTEVYRSPAALPQVAPASLEEDLARRDFTVNALAIRIDPGSWGRRLDPFDGESDLHAGRIRALHSGSFVDDPTRGFRAAELAGRLGFKVEPRTAAWIRAASEDGILARVSSARVRREIERTLRLPNLESRVKWLRRLGLLQALEPELRPPLRSLRGVSRLERKAEWIGTAAPGVPIQLWVSCVALLLLGVRPKSRARLIERIRPDRASRRTLLDAVATVGKLRTRLAVDPGPRRVSRTYHACHGLPPELLLVAMCVPGSRRVGSSISRYLEDYRHRRLAIGGRDLLEAGIPEGPQVARGLSAALTAHLDGRAPEAEAQLQVALLAARRA